MSKYLINQEFFNNKKEIVEKCQNIIDRNIDKKEIIGKDKEFLLELFKYHPDCDEKLEELDFIFVDIDNWGKNNCFWIKNKKGFIDDISYHYCIKYIPVNSEKRMDLKLPFGKYKGQSIYEINDNEYLNWLYNKSDFLDRGLKTKIGQFLRFGYIPFNPIAYRAEKKNNRNEAKK